MRIAGVRSPKIETCATPGHLRNLLGQEKVGVIVDVGERQRVGARRQQQDRRVGRIDLL